MPRLFSSTKYVAAAALVLLTACSSRPSLAFWVRDTVFVNEAMTIRAFDSMLALAGDSAAEVRNLVARQGEFVSTSVNIDPSGTGVLDRHGLSLIRPLLPQGAVTDYIHLFSPADSASLDSLCTAIYKEGVAAIAVVTVDSAWVRPGGLDSLVTRLHDSWGLGDPDKNDGILIGICPACRRIRISNGSGISQRLGDAETKAIIDGVITPEYKAGRYYEGTRRGIGALAAKLRAAR